MRIAFLIANAFAMGGTVRTTVNLANSLAERHEVEIISMARHCDRPFFPLDPRVRLRAMAPTPDWSGAPPGSWLDRRRARRPVRWLPPTEAKRQGVFNARTERALRRTLRGLDADVLVSTRPGLNLAAARFAPRRLLRVGQEHIHWGNHSDGVRLAARLLYPRLDALTVLTEADRRAYQRDLRVPPDWAVRIPNALPGGDFPRAPLENPIVVAAGRLGPEKGYDKLLDAFALVAAERPEWRLRLYGQGGLENRLRRRIQRLGLDNNAAIMKRTDDLPGELAKGSVLAVSSRVEGFGMTIIESFACGVPVVSFDCPHGPGEIITHGADGLLVPPGDVQGLAAGLLRLIDDPALRTRMGAAALAAAEDYRPAAVTARWEEFLAERLSRRR
ncbi:glycosyltransferase family 4 protein [Allonocardiopsis opalescens]|uniref:Glycosyltransferase involved in cell wall biosynthesis n=1 Tax=Allonocardiopsis opalescens TaxID=1144618 RepID=A0A2T0QC79_9ACTN|nr:glycosyltransferase family 4 protein [Allonocardiopsis opalescens]PRY01481.1 glycosyltransferase involved in cell wall biosynthesis [Allonocardiopsis opalescens]